MCPLVERKGEERRGTERKGGAVIHSERKTAPAPKKMLYSFTPLPVGATRKLKEGHIIKSANHTAPVQSKRIIVYR